MGPTWPGGNLIHDSIGLTVDARRAVLALIAQAGCYGDLLIYVKYSTKWQSYSGGDRVSTDSRERVFQRPNGPDGARSPRPRANRVQAGLAEARVASSEASNPESGKNPLRRRGRRAKSFAFPSRSRYSVGVRTASRWAMPAIGLLTLLAGCEKKQNATLIDFPMGEKTPNPPLTYTVVESTWRTQLGEGFKIRSPQQRFFLITLSVTNGGGRDVSLPLFALEDANGKTYQELENTEGVENALGILRTVSPAQTLQGRLLFDVPLGSYRIKLTDGGAPGSEKFVTVQIPLRMDADTTVQPRLPQDAFAK
jgi:hypothetical protein